MDTPPALAPFGYVTDNDIPTLDREMPLLKKLVAQHKSAAPLRGITALLIQHQLGNQGPQTEALIELGLDPKALFWLDIPYTSSERFRITMADRLAIPEPNFWTHRYRVLESYDTYQLRRTQEMIRQLLRKRPERLVVLDDGAYFVAAASSFRRQFSRVAVVEQTTRGLIKIKDNPALAHFARRIPVVNVAKSKPKLELESPWIGIAVAAALDFQLRTLPSDAFRIDSTSPCLVLGYGAIGNMVAKHLRARAAVFVCDTDSAQMDQAKRDGFETWDRSKHSPKFRLVVGCSGRQSFGVGDFNYLDRHAVLASASSGSVELSRRDFIELAAASQIDDIRIDVRRLTEDNLHQPLRIHLVDRQVIFLNAGFPINFDGRLNCVPAKYMQPTAALMVQATMQAVQTLQEGRSGEDDDGFVEVDAVFCEDLMTSFSKQLSLDELQLLNASAISRS